MDIGSSGFNFSISLSHSRSRLFGDFLGSFGVFLDLLLDGGISVGNRLGCVPLLLFEVGLCVLDFLLGLVLDSLGLLFGLLALLLGLLRGVRGLLFGGFNNLFQLLFGVASGFLGVFFRLFSGFFGFALVVGCSLGLGFFGFFCRLSCFFSLFLGFLLGFGSLLLSLSLFFGSFLFCFSSIFCCFGFCFSGIGISFDINSSFGVSGGSYVSIFLHLSELVLEHGSDLVPFGQGGKSENSQSDGSVLHIEILKRKI